ncbi:MAG TPA: restriction endonuclease subunit S [Burkholderiaceae bacterium]|jgi:type I restriction enzyme S subunit|nr:restriction endonuclease subunit S [Burkholderiaceae bacterium]HMM52159.1 restriction endonuclease subunit S [Burkholderiaceae bacterium]
MIGGLKSYPAMKDSGVPWLGEVPAHWDIQRGKWLFRTKKEINSDLRNAHVLSLTLRGVVNNDPDAPEGLVPKDYGTYQLFSKGDLVFKLIDLENLRTSRVGLVHEDGIMSPAYIRLIQTHGGQQRYFYHQYFDLYQRGIFNQLGAGVRSTLGAADLLEIPVATPSPAEQTAIVRFLDYMDRRIRRYIRARQKLIKLLEEQKQAIIHRAVTRGLDPNVRLKPSGVEWLGDVPEHWEVLRCRYIFREVDERSADGSEQHLSMSQRLGLVPSDLVENRTLVSESYAGGKLCEVGDLVLNRLKAHLGVFALARHAGVISPDYTVLRPVDSIGIEYFEQVLRSPVFRYELRVRAKGIVEGFWRLYTDDFYDIRLPVPPPQERNAIVAHFVAETATVEQAVRKAEREIALLREYRTRLIADVVTGKLDVREAAARLPDEDDDSDSLDESDDTEESGAGENSDVSEEEAEA